MSALYHIKCGLYRPPCLLFTFNVCFVFAACDVNASRLTCLTHASRHAGAFRTAHINVFYVCASCCLGVCGSTNHPTPVTTTLRTHARRSKCQVRRAGLLTGNACLPSASWCCRDVLTGHTVARSRDVCISCAKLPMAVFILHGYHAVPSYAAGRTAAWLPLTQAHYRVLRPFQSNAHNSPSRRQRIRSVWPVAVLHGPHPTAVLHRCNRARVSMLWHTRSQNHVRYLLEGHLRSAALCPKCHGVDCGTRILYAFSSAK